MNTRTVIIVVQLFHESYPHIHQWLKDVGVQVLEDGFRNDDLKEEQNSVFSFHQKLIKSNFPDFPASSYSVDLSSEDLLWTDSFVNGLKNEVTAWNDPFSALFLCEWFSILKNKNVQPKFLFIYNPVENAIDNLVKTDIENIRSEGTILNKWLKLRSYKKKQLDRQQSYLTLWKTFALQIKSFNKNHENDCIVLPEISQDSLQKLNDTISENWKLPLKNIVLPIFENAIRTATLKKYNDLEIQEVHDYFIKN